MKRFLSIVSLSLLGAVAAASAAVISDIPDPFQQGGMIHVYTTFTDINDNGVETFFVQFDVAHDTLEMKPLSMWSPGDNFDPADPWYSALDPSQAGKMFNSQYGFWINSNFSDLLPLGMSIGLRLVNSTPGLSVYYDRLNNRTSPGEPAETGAVFDPVFTPEHDYVLWDGTMWHPVFVADGAGVYNATFEFFIADEQGNQIVDYTTIAGYEPGYGTTEFTLTWIAVPEPGAGALIFGAIALLALGRRRKGGGS